MLIKNTCRCRRCGATNDNRRGRITGETFDFVAVPKDLMGFVIGKKGSSIKLIETESGARITSDSDQGGFSVSGNEEQRARAKQLIHQKMVSKFKKLITTKKTIVLNNAIQIFILHRKT